MGLGSTGVDTVWLFLNAISPVARPGRSFGAIFEQFLGGEAVEISYGRRVRGDPALHGRPGTGGAASERGRSAGGLRGRRRVADLELDAFRCRRSGGFAVSAGERR